MADLQVTRDPRNLPAVPDDDIEPVIDGTVVEPPARPKVYVLHPVTRPAVQVFNVVNIVVRHEHTKRTTRHAGYAALGAYVLLKRWRESRTTARYDRYIRAAEQSGNHESALEWDKRRAEFTKARHDRRMQRTASRLAVFLAIPRILFGLVIVLAVLGVLLAVAERRIGAVVDPVLWLADAVKIAVVVVAVTWTPVVFGAAAVFLGVLWHLGRDYAASGGPSWLRTSADDDDITIDETTIANALEALRIPQIRDYLKQGLPLQYIVPCRVDGRGTYAQIRLPKGVTAEKVARRRADLATGLYRSATEVWPSTGGEAGILDLWMADKGALAEGAGPYPLLGEGLTNVFKGLPFGKSLRGDSVRIPVIGRNTICGGMPEQGKSSAARVVACGYTLDIRTELRIFVPDTNFDFEHFKPRCSRYLMGAEDEYIEGILGELEELKDELQRRGQLLVDCGAPEVTEDVASTVPGLHPVFWLLEEAHVAIQHKKHGKDIGQLLGENVKLDRKRGVHMKVSTQAPTKDSMPRDVTRNCSNGIAFAVGDHVANDALLGQGAYAAGHRATDLIPGEDRGTALCKGFNGQRSEVVQVHFIDVKRGHDQVTPIVQRALAALADEGRPVPGTERGAAAITVRDLLADLSTVLAGRSGRARVADLPGMLRSLAPSWGPYRTLNGTELKRLLDDEQVRTTNTGNVRELDPADLHRAIAWREDEE